jgi:hypothetical protein
MTIQITGLQFERHRPDKWGNTGIAKFNVVAGGVELRGCRLVITKKGGLTCFTAREKDDDGFKFVRIVDSGLRNVITREARRTYLLFGGKGLPAWANKLPVRADGSVEPEASDVFVKTALDDEDDAPDAGLHKFLAASERGPNADAAAA